MKKFLTHKKGHPDIRVILNAGPERGMFDTILPFSILQKVDLCATAWDFYIPFKSNKFFF